MRLASSAFEAGATRPPSLASIACAATPTRWTPALPASDSTALSGTLARTALPATEPFDVVIVDPPSMTSRKSQITNVLAAYRKLYRAAQAHVAPGGLLVSACCTSRVERGVFRKTVRDVLPSRFTLERDLPPEPDHPVGFAQADYLKILLWRAGS